VATVGTTLDATGAITPPTPVATAIARPTVPPAAPPPAAPEPSVADLRSDRRRVLVALLTAVALVVVAVVVGERLQHRDRRMSTFAPPFYGPWGRVWGRGYGRWPLLALGLGPVVVVVARRLLDRARGAAVVLGAGALAGIWTVALSLSEGTAGLTRAIGSGYDYLLGVSLVGDPHRFLARYLDLVPQLPLHGRAHPPGPIVTLWGLDRIGLGGTLPNALLAVTGFAAAVAAALVALRSVAGPTAARAAAPFVALAPATVFATANDAWFAGVAGWAVTLLVLASGRRDRWGDVEALAGGLLAGVTAYLTYPAGLFLLPAAAVALMRRRWRPLVVGAVGLAVVATTVTLLGFSWFAGLAETRAQYAVSAARFRPYWYFVFADLAILVVVIGPAAVAGVARLRDRRAWWLVGAALAGVTLADLSGLSKAEVERIWLPFVPWLMLACCALPTRGWRRTGWLAAQVVLALALQMTLRSPW
jgi:methylthioxylose transferase